MMPEEWPIAASAAESAAPARTVRLGRLDTVRADFFLDPAKRLTEQERALMTAMLNRLVAETADAVRAALPDGLLAANDDGNAALVEALNYSGLLDDRALIGLLLRRADDERIIAAARARNGGRDPRMLQGLVSHPEGDVAAAAMALILGRGRRRDRFGQWQLSFDDLPEASASALVHAVAAGLRNELPAGAGETRSNLPLAAAAARVLDAHDQNRSIDSLTAALVAALDEAGALTDTLALAAAGEGETGFIAAMLGRRVGIPVSIAAEELMSGESSHAMALLRMADASRELAAGLLGSLGDLLGIDDAGAAIALFDRLTPGEVDSARAWLLTPPAFREALTRLESDHG